MDNHMMRFVILAYCMIALMAPTILAGAIRVFNPTIDFHHTVATLTGYLSVLLSLAVSAESIWGICQFVRRAWEPQAPVVIQQVQIVQQVIQVAPADPRGYVYLLRSETGWYKIGRTVNPQNRRRTFKLNLPFDVEYEHIIPCHNQYKIERYFHEHFADKRIKGTEWFNLTEDDVMYFKAFERA